MISINSVTKIYQRRNQQICAIDKVSFEVAPGEFISVIGRSGSGKSTLLLTLGGMLSPTEGDVQVAGQPLYQLSIKDRALFRRKKMGFVFQQFNLIPYLTALENVQLSLLMAGCDSNKQRRRAEELLESVDLLERKDHKPAELSVGQLQRVALARMLANDPDLIFADEPTGNLDPATGKNIMNFLFDLNKKGKTIVMVTHDMTIAQATQRQVTIQEGKLTNDVSTLNPGRT